MVVGMTLALVQHGTSNGVVGAGARYDADLAALVGHDPRNAARPRDAHFLRIGKLLRR
jgi:hypothetical protein